MLLENPPRMALDPWISTWRFPMRFPFHVASSVLCILLVGSMIAEAADRLIGTEAREWQLTDWINSQPLALKDLRGKVVLVRWWTGGGCPYCKATAPALSEFHEKYASKGLVVIGVYHHKSRTPLDVDQVKQLVEDFGFSFPVAIDLGWRTLTRWWLSDGHRQWTSVSFLIDRKGIIRHIHEGSRYVKGDKAYQTMRTKIEELLQEK
jgi:thiol-disulfide isomerase/thioredoxin